MPSLDAKRIARLRAYAEPFASRKPALFEAFPGGSDPLFPFAPDSNRGLGLLLLQAALYSPGAEEWAAGLLRGLYRAFGARIFKLNRIPYPELQRALSELPRRADPEEQRRVPGILRSVCDFFYDQGGLRAWLEKSEDWELCARELCESIFWMGKRSRLRTKARYFFWLLSYLPDFGRHYPQAQAFLWPASEGHGRFHAVFRPRAAATSPEARLRWFTELGGEIFPERAWRLFPALQAYMQPRPGRNYACRQVWKQCRPCPLQTDCPAARQFAAEEGGA